MFVEQPLASPGSAKYAFKFLVLNFHPGPEHPDPVQGDHGAAPHPDPQRPQLASSSTSSPQGLPARHECGRGESRQGGEHCEHLNTEQGGQEMF